MKVSVQYPFVISLALMSIASSSIAADAGSDKEKCFGIAKAGQNDCASGLRRLHQEAADAARP